ncbi:MAG: carboxypeptidase regulatory-like domain-containing protein [Acidobacteria bacterium]|nr:carboxypeptidase regulatory-like domain-containing protein [Acidobacteriota bacterium]
MKAPRTPRVKMLCKTPAALLLLSLLAPAAARAQAPQKRQTPTQTAAAVTAAATPTPAPRGALAGRVVGESGEPIPEVPVSLAPRISGVRRGGPDYTVAADESGGFRFEGLDPGLYEVYASLPGFVTETDVQTGRSLGPYRPGDNVTVRLVKGGVVTGTVTDGLGQPLVSLNVRAVRVRDLDGGQPAIPFSSGGGEDRTDDRGVYRIYGLRPGLYIVYAGGYLSTSFPFGGGSGEVATFYPSGTRDTAAEVAVRGGQESGGIDIRLRDDPARRITGTVDSPTGSLGEMGVGVNLVYASTAITAGAAFVSAINPGDRSFSFDSVADGEYDLQATVNGRDGITLASAPQRVSVRGADVTGLRLTLAPLASASGTMRFEPAAEPGRPAPESCKAVRATQLPQETLVTASAAAGQRLKPGGVFSRTSLPQSATPDDAGAFNVRGLEAGRYRLSVRLFDEALYVRSIQAPAPAATPPPRAAGAGAQRTTTTATAATTNAAPRDVFDVKAGQQFSGLVVRVAEGAASFAGSVAAAEPAAGAPPVPLPPFSQLRVHLVPQERERAEDTLHYYEAPVASDGTFAFKNLAPGRYLVLARPFVAEPGESAPRPAALDTAARANLRREAESANTIVELQPCQRTADFVLRFPPPAPATK